MRIGCAEPKSRAFVAAMAVLLTVLAGTLLLSGVPGAEGASDSEGPIEYYVYGNKVIGTYDNADPEISVRWEITDGDGNPVDPKLYAITALDGTESPTDRKVTVDATNLSKVVMKQTVSKGEDSDTVTIIAIPLHMSSGETRTITFVSQEKIVKQQTFSSTTVVKKDDVQVYAPTPERTGYVFNGWYLDQECTERYDPTEPVEKSLTLYAGWRESTGGNVTVIVVGKYLVVFNVGPGLGYDIVGQGSDWISFRYEVQDGYIFADGSIRVEANKTLIQPEDGVYRIQCTTDTDVQLYGTRQYSIGYDLTNAKIAADGFTDPPRIFPDGGFKATVQSTNGNSLSVRVYSNGADITAQCVNGDRIILDSVSGNILIVASAPDSFSEFPWWILVLVIVILLAVIAVMVLRRRRRRNILPSRKGEGTSGFPGGRPGESASALAGCRIPGDDSKMASHRTAESFRACTKLPGHRIYMSCHYPSLY